MTEALTTARLKRAFIGKSTAYGISIRHINVTFWDSRDWAVTLNSPARSQLCHIPGRVA